MIPTWQPDDIVEELPECVHYPDQFDHDCFVYHSATCDGALSIPFLYQNKIYQIFRTGWAAGPVIGKSTMFLLMYQDENEEWQEYPRWAAPSPNFMGLYSSHPCPLPVLENFYQWKIFDFPAEELQRIHFVPEYEEFFMPLIHNPQEGIWYNTGYPDFFGPSCEVSLAPGTYSGDFWIVAKFSIYSGYNVGKVILYQYGSLTPTIVALGMLGSICFLRNPAIKK
jgi:hypothetical protein